MPLWFFTPKALHSKAQGQRRSRATLGGKIKINIYPEGVGPSILCNAFSVKAFVRPSFTQGALRDTGLWNLTASR
jgi:hypothetical protein